MTATARIVRAEVRKLTLSRAFLGALGAAVGIAVFSIVVDAAVAGRQGQPPLGSTLEIHQMLKLGPVTCIAMLVLGILASGGEYRHHTIIASVLTAPRRGVYVAAKACAVLLAGIVLTAVTFSIGIGTIYAVLLPHHMVPHALDWVRVVGGSVVASTFFGLIGTALGFLTRSTVGAVVAFVGWVVFGELTILHTLSPHLEKWLPVGLATSLTNTVASGPDALPSVLAALVLALDVVALLFAAAVMVSRRDIA